MTPQDVRAMVDELRSKATGPDRDSEVDHGTEDAIYQGVLEAIATGTATDPGACAAEAIKAADISFARWYA